MACSGGSGFAPVRECLQGLKRNGFPEKSATEACKEGNTSARAIECMRGLHHKTEFFILEWLR